MNSILRKSTTLFRRAALLAAAVLGIASCERDSDLDLPLAVNQNRIELAKNGGNTKIMIYSDGDWSVKLSKPVDWASLSLLEGTGNSDVIFYYTENLEASRSVDLIIDNSHGTKSIKIVQAGVEAQLAFTKNEIVIPRNAAKVLLPITTNLRDQLSDVSITAVEMLDGASSEAEWVGETELTPEGLLVDVSAHAGEQSRQARITLTLIDGKGTKTSASTNLTQTVDEPSISFRDANVRVSRKAATVSLALKGNMLNALSESSVKVTEAGGAAATWVERAYVEEGFVKLVLTENTSGSDRTATVSLTVEGIAPATTTLVQGVDDPTIAFKHDGQVLRISPKAGNVTLPLEGSLISSASNAEVSVTFAKNTPSWISSAEVSGEGVVCAVAANNTAAERQATVELKYTLADNSVLTSSVVLAQVDKAPELAFVNETTRIPRQAATALLEMAGEAITVLPMCTVEAIYADGAQSWLTSAEVSGGTAIACEAGENTSGAERKATIRVTYAVSAIWTITAEATLVQSPEYPSMKFTRAGETVEVERSMTSTTLGITNNGFGKAADCTFTVSDDAKSWITGFEPSTESVLCKLTANSTGAARTGTVTMTFKPEGAPEIVSSVTITQTAEKDFREELIPGATGSVTIADDITLYGIVISDAGNVNMEYNYADQTGVTGTNVKVDATISEKTAYVQREDGAYGFRLQFATAADNTLKRYSAVEISLKGATLTKESEPTRYTISGLTAANITKQTEGTAADLVKKVRTLKGANALTDDDVYTWVSIENAQIGINDGAYTNFNEDFYPYINSIPLTFFDHNGGSIRMLTNAAATWRRDGTGVPQGSGTLNGIIVHTKIKRIAGGDGNIGRYQIRVVDKADIALNQTAGTSDAQTLVEWNWNDAVLDKKAEVLPSNAGTVTGEIYSTIAWSMHNETGGTAKEAYMSMDAFNATDDSTKGKSVGHAAGFRVFDKWHWWGFVDSTFANNKKTEQSGKGEAIVAKFSTITVPTDKKLMLIFDVMGGSGSVGRANRFPTFWHVEYSTDGTIWNKASDEVVSIRPYFKWNDRDTQPLATAMYVDYAIELPGVLLGKETVYVALRASSTICEHGVQSTSNDPTLNLTVSDVGQGNVNFNTFSIRYF